MITLDKSLEEKIDMLEKEARACRKAGSGTLGWVGVVSGPIFLGLQIPFSDASNLFTMLGAASLIMGAVMVLVAWRGERRLLSVKEQLAALKRQQAAAVSSAASAVKDRKR